MADAPAGGGGISGAEIIVLVVLALGALAVLSGHPISPAQNTAAPAKSTAASHCVISLSRPKTREVIGSVVTVVGSITPCSPQDPLTTGVNVQVVDSTGALMSVYTPIPVTATDNTRGTFSANIPVSGSPAAGTGYVIVTGPNRSDGTTTTTRVAIQFAHY